MIVGAIRVDRRRKGSGPVGRAQAPRRDTGGRQGAGLPPSGGPRPAFGGLPTRGRIGGCGTVILVLLIVGYYLLSGGQGIDLGGVADQSLQPEPPGLLPAQQGLPASNFTPPPPAASSGQTWTVMLYQDADDQILERDIYLDLNEAERVGSSNIVSIVAQIDRYRLGFQGDGNWTSARRYYVTQDSDLDRIHSPVVQELGEVDMSSGETLADFVQWAAQNYPADKYVLILSDHGMGWPGGWSDPAPGGSETSRAPIASRLGDNLYLNELDEALGRRGPRPASTDLRSWAWMRASCRRSRSWPRCSRMPTTPWPPRRSSPPSAGPTRPSSVHWSRTRT